MHQSCLFDLSPVPSLHSFVTCDVRKLMKSHFCHLHLPSNTPTPTFPCQTTNHSFKTDHNTLQWTDWSCLVNILHTISDIYTTAKPGHLEQFKVRHVGFIVRKDVIIVFFPSSVWLQGKNIFSSFKISKEKYQI